MEYLPQESLTPQQIVSELDKYIIGQNDAKKSVAVALRNRYRRSRLPKEAQEEISPKNIIMIGPTGVGKTEIARRLAKLVRAPFVKVEATKFTEVGYVGRDVESIVRDLVEVAIRMVNDAKIEGVEYQAEKLAEERLLDIMAPYPKKKSAMPNPFEMFFNNGQNSNNTSANNNTYDADMQAIKDKREILKQKLRRQELEEDMIEVEVEDTNAMNDMLASMGMDDSNGNFSDMMGGFMPKKMKKRKVTVEQARKILAQQEAEKLVDFDEVKQEAIQLAENHGIIFLDEIDKIASKGSSHGPDVSREGVQRDILPIVEGSVVKTKYGNVRTDHMLFIAAGAFHVAKPTDLIPELQGRFPVTVHLESLTKSDLERILREPGNALPKQYAQLLKTEGVELVFTDEAITRLASITYDMNEQTENLGARRLHTIMERLLADIMFFASDYQGQQFVIDEAYVNEKLSDMIDDRDLSKFML
ncbi:MAG: ATP-dependent protease ATPase subunit HslU [Peptococcaceae bacterium]|jgi:ATP-dependent HslUV protease ATP-binding subunit HslU|nr:ATP-dependent protease ATPase subunit HslU [Peptococcaceae bacterium]MBQ2004903.1 ATP-dependent protease ATPase subunit HslU [Peptococcaceae bacterium]MBQ2369317.1 ATP-dependent protease ATPase subunit HslU [Peptococcaceae bacterium]MBQ5615276.1 ATP-dependent protease ATPase subunit HslU [Peptococcaceae bacterium]MBQ5658738.1 ATP-dependent protease ATPase subunit HslU [Peptococcaceae bacterium]